MAVGAQELFFPFTHHSLAQTWLPGPEFRRHPYETFQRQHHIQGQSRQGRPILHDSNTPIGGMPLNSDFFYTSNQSKFPIL